MALYHETRPRGRRLEEESSAALASPRNPSRSSSRRPLEASTFPLNERLERSDRSSANFLARDVKAVADAQGRLVRVIEDVSQELSQRLAEHDRQLAEFTAHQIALRDAVHKVQVEEAANHDSLAAEYLRLRTSDGDTAARLNFLESKVVGVEKAQSSLNNKLTDLEHTAQRHLPARIQDVQVTHQKHFQDLQQKVLRQVEEQRSEFLQFQGQAASRVHSDGLLNLQRQFETHRQEFESRLQTLGPEALLPQMQQHLESTLLQQLSQQLSSQLHQILQQQLEQLVQPQLEKQLEQQVQQHWKAHYTGMQELRDMCQAEAGQRKELASQLKQRLQEQESNVAMGQEALRQEAAKREQHLAELQDAAQRLAQTAMQRAQASTDAHAHVFSTSSSLANRLAVVEGELQSVQRQEKERQQKRIARLEEDLAKSPMLSPRDRGGSNESKALDQPNLIRMLDELRVQFFAELSDSRKQVHQLSGRLSRCEADVAELQQAAKASNAVPSFIGTQASPRHGASNNDSCSTPDWPVAAWEQVGEPGNPGSSSKPLGLPPVPPDARGAGQTKVSGPTSADETLWRPSDSPTRTSPKAPSSAHSKGSPGHNSTFLGNLPEGPQLSHGSHALQDSPAKGAATRFGVLPPPKVTPATPLPLQAE